MRMEQKRSREKIKITDTELEAMIKSYQIDKFVY